ncbi:MAG: hypothetical protein H6Q89_4838, partial [Myxococcaceae bacterium]|nr:hypothetical protein [Myxococcaceae bacterium]
TPLFTPYAPVQGVLPMLSNGDVVYPTASGLIRVSLAGANPTTSILLTTAALDAALGTVGRLDPDGGTLNVDQRFQGLAAAPDDHLWAVVERRVILGPKYQWLIEVAPTGQVTVRRGPDPGVSIEAAIVYDGVLDAMLFDARKVAVGPGQPFESLGVVPRLERDGLSARVPPWPAFPQRKYFPAGEEWKGLLGASSGSAWVATQTPAWAARPLQLDKSLADFDRDGLKRSEEDALGTSDFVADSDGDTVNDGLELRLSATLPADAGSAPPIHDAGQGLVLAETILPATWQLDAGADCLSSGGYAAGRALVISNDPFCQVGFPSYRFVGPDGQPLSALRPQSVVPPLLTPDLGHAFAWKGEGRWVRLDLQTGASDPLDLGGRVIGELFPLSKDVVLATEGLGTAAPRLWRFGPQGAFAVIDLGRSCPIVGSAPELARCAELTLPAVEGFTLRGWDPERRLALAVVTTDRGRILFGIDETRAVYLSELLAIGDGLEPSFLAPLGTRGFALQVHGSSVTESFWGTVRLDDLFHPLAASNPLESPEGVAGVYRNGFFARLSETYPVEPASAARCSRVADRFSCDGDQAPVVLQSETRTFPAELVPVGPAIEKGEVLFFATGLHGVESARFRQREGSYGPFAGGPGWRLWRFTPVGAALPWLDARDFTAQLDAAARAKVAARPLGPITAMSASPDSLGFCLVEPSAGRVWELKLDPASRLLSSIALTEAAGAVGCAWESAGALAILSTGPAMIRVGGKTLAVSGADLPGGLMRVPGRWLVFSDRKPARCVGDDGAVVTSPVSTTAATAGFGAVAWLDEAGQGFLASPDNFCAGKPQERLGTTTSNVWMDAYRGFTSRSVLVQRGAIALRPDGLLLLATPSVLFGALGFDPPSAVRPLFGYFPSFVPLDVDQRITEVDPFRAAAPRAFLAARKPLEVSAMVLVPGADATVDFGHLVRPAPVAPMVPGLDGGTGGGGGGGGGSGKPCGCSAAEGGAAVLGLLLLLRRSRRR